MMTSGMGACIIGDGKNLTLDTGDGAYIMKDIVVSQWTVIADCGVSDVTAFGDLMPRVVSTMRQVDCTISFTSRSAAHSMAPMPRQIETYSVTDMLNMINAKLQERENVG